MRLPRLIAIVTAIFTLTATGLAGVAEAAFPVAQNGMTVRYGKLVALYDAAREGERPARDNA